MLNQDECLNEDAVDAIYNLYEGFKHGKGGFDTFFKTVTAWFVLTVHLR